MPTDPAFLFYDGDAARDVSHMNRLERGCYFDLIQAQRKFHGITMEQARKILGKDFDTCWDALLLVLKKDKGLYFIEWVRESIEKRNKFAAIQRKRISDYWAKKKDTTVIPRNNHGNTLENENVNENNINTDTDIKRQSSKKSISKSIDVDKNKVINKKFTPPTLQEVKDYIAKNKYNVDGEVFFKYFTEADPQWVDSEGKAVKNWKQKIITWNSNAKRAPAKASVPSYQRPFKVDPPPRELTPEEKKIAQDNIDKMKQLVGGLAASKTTK